MNIDLYSSEPITTYEPLCIGSVTIEYQYYNETHALIEVTLDNIRFKGCGARLADSVRILYLVDRLTWNTYIVDGDDLIPIDPIPLAIPVVDPKALPQIVLHKLEEILTESPEGLNESLSNSSINKYVGLVAKSVFNIGYPPFALALTPPINQDRDYNILVWSEGFDIKLWYTTKYLSFDRDILELVWDDEKARDVLLKPIREYLRTGDDEELVLALLRYLTLRDYTDGINMETWPWQLILPLTDHVSIMTLTLPLPRSVSEALGSPRARYIHLETFVVEEEGDATEGAIRVLLDYRLPQWGLMDYWYIASACVTYARKAFKELYEEYLNARIQNSSSYISLEYIRAKIGEYLDNCASRLSTMELLAETPGGEEKPPTGEAESMPGQTSMSTRISSETITTTTSGYTSHTETATTTQRSRSDSTGANGPQYTLLKLILIVVMAIAVVLFLLKYKYNR